MWPLIPHGQSDTACLDNALELLVAGGYPLAHAMMMLIPEAWAGNPLMDAKRKAFYEYHAALMEPWDGPAAIAFTDGRQIGATLDRNGLRPARFIVTDDDLVIMASEVGVLPIPEEKIVRKWRLQPGKMLLIDLEEGRIIEDEEIKRTPRRGRALRGVAEADPVQARRTARAAETTAGAVPNDPTALLDRQQAFGYTQEDIAVLPRADGAATATIRSARWAPTRRSPCSRRKPKLLYNYFKQNFAQVTNPPIDPIREELVMSPGLDDRAAAEPARPRRRRAQAAGSHAADPDQRRSREDPLDRRAARRRLPHRDDRHAPGRPPKAPRAWRRRSTAICREATDAVLADNNILILSDRARVGRPHPDPGAAGDRGGASPPDPPGPAHADRPGRRDRRSARSASFLRAGRLRRRGDQSLSRVRDAGADPRRRTACRSSAYEVQKNYIKAIGKGILKVMSKMGISTYQSYCGAQIFDAVGLSSRLRREVLHRHRHHDRGRRPAARSPRRRVRRHRDAYGDNPIYRNMLDVGGDYAFRLRGEDHAWTPESGRQAAARGARQHCRTSTRPSPQTINEQSERLLTIRGLMEFKFADDAGAARRGRAGRRDRQALRHRRDELRLDQPRGAHHAGHRHEPHRRPLEHRRGRRGSRPLQAAAERRFDALGDQAGRLGPLRRHRRIPGQCRRHPDQDGAGRQARRRRPAARPQGRQEHRQGAPLDAGRRPDLAAAAPRHLFDRGSGAADPRPEERQPEGAHLGQAGLRSRRRHGRRGRRQGARRPCHDLGLRRRHRRLAADLAHPCRLARGRSAWPRPSRRWCSTACAAASRCRSTAACAPAATSPSARCSAPTSSASPPRR